MAKSTAAKIRDTLDIAGFKSMSSTVFNAAPNKSVNEVAEQYWKLDSELTVAKIKLAYRGMASEFEIDTAFHTRINSWTSVMTALCARTKLVAESAMEVTGEGVCSQQLKKGEWGRFYLLSTKGTEGARASRLMLAAPCENKFLTS
jgi:hypothetical protein